MNLYCCCFLFSPSAPSCHTAIKTFKLKVFLLASVDIEFMLLQYKSNQFKSQFQEKEVWTVLVLEERATKSNWKLTPIFLPPQFSWGGGEGGGVGCMLRRQNWNAQNMGGGSWRLHRPRSVLCMLLRGLASQVCMSKVDQFHIRSFQIN